MNILSKFAKSLQSGVTACFRFLKNMLAKPGGIVKLLAVVGVLLLLLVIVVFIFDSEPDVKPFDGKHPIQLKSNSMVTGSATTASLQYVLQTMLDKRGGYMSNDILPPFVWMDNIPAWEFGVLLQSRDLARAMRNDFSRSRSQSIENPQLAKAEPALNYDHNSWIFPASEDKYREALDALDLYLHRLGQANQPDTQFYARADNLADWLSQVEKRLGSMSQRLASAIGQDRPNTDLAGERGARQSTTTGASVYSKTPWLEIDDVFYEARGTTWALIHFLRAVEIDFADVLDDKNAATLLRQIIVELEQTQRHIWSPMVLNGSGFGFTANHSLVMASYISRANASMMELRRLLSDG